MSDVKLPVDFTVDERKSAWGLIYELFDMAPIDPTDQWKLAALLLRARALTPKQAAAEEMYKALKAYKQAQEAFEEELEIKERAICEGWDNDPTGSSHVVAAIVKAAAANKRAEELTAAALAKAGQP